MHGQIVHSSLFLLDHPQPTPQVVRKIRPLPPAPLRKMCKITPTTQPLPPPNDYTIDMPQCLF